MVTSAGADFSELPDSAQTPTPTTTTAAAIAPIQRNFFEDGGVNDVEDSTSNAGPRLLAGGTVATRVEEGARGGGRIGSWAGAVGQGGADGRGFGLSEIAGGGGGGGGGTACKA